MWKLIPSPATFYPFIHCLPTRLLHYYCILYNKFSFLCFVHLLSLLLIFFLFPLFCVVSYFLAFHVALTRAFIKDIACWNELRSNVENEIKLNVFDCWNKLFSIWNLLSFSNHPTHLPSTSSELINN